MKLIVCRHGETDFNVQKRLQGKMETKLNWHGRKQAKLIAARLKSEDFEHAFSSTRARCRQTANEIMKFHKCNLELREELSEVDLGIYTGMNREEIEEKFPGHWAERVDNKYNFKHKGGESYKEVDEKRVAKFLQELREKYSARTVLIVTHAGTGRLVIGSMLGLTPDEKMHFEFPNECVYFVEYRPHKTVVGYELVESNKKGQGFLSIPQVAKNKK